MPGFKDEGVVLKRRDFGEADRLLTVLTRNNGKITVLAKGVRRITSRRAGNIELLNRVMMYLHKGKNFNILTEATALDTFSKLKEDLILSTYAYHLIELVDKLLAEGQENRFIYEKFVEVLKKISQNPRQIFIRAFEVKVLSFLGFWSNTSLDTSDVSTNIKELLYILEHSDWPEIERISLDENEALELERILRYHIEKTIEGKLKSRQFLKNL